MNLTMYPLYAAALSCVIAQLLKPFVRKLLHGDKFDWTLIFASGKMPSSHSSTVSALCLSVGLVEHFNSTLFAVTFVFSIIVCFDAANVRYYAGQNISVTKALIDDLKELSLLKFDDPIYAKKMKDVLGHTYSEVFFGIIIGLVVSYLLYLTIY